MDVTSGSDTKSGGPSYQDVFLITPDLKMLLSLPLVSDEIE